MAVKADVVPAAIPRVGNDEMMTSRSQCRAGLSRCGVLLVSCLALAGAAWGWAPQGPGGADEVDELYRDRANLASAERATSLWAERARQDPHRREDTEPGPDR